jgi:hypothetical protein
MKTWNSYGSEHSANLVMIGTFKDAASLNRAKDAINELSQFVGATDADYSKVERYPPEARRILEKFGLQTISPAELDQFRYDIRTESEDDRIIVTTDEIEISAFLKILFDNEARIEVFSRHFYPEPS